MSPVTYMELGINLVKRGDLENAIFAFCRAIKLNPQYAKAYNNLGLVFRKRKQLYEAEACFRRTVEINPVDAAAFNNLGLVLSDLDAVDKAEACFLEAIKINPTIPEVYNNLGIVLEENNRLDEAEFFRKAIEIRDDYAEAYYNLGTLLCNTKSDIAEKYICHALTLRSNYLEAELALALLYLLRGQLEKGWSSYEKTRRKKYGFTECTFPYWHGEDLTDCSILLYWEYGFGDTIQFVRYVEKVLTLTKKIVLWVQKPLERLMKDTYPELIIFSGEGTPPGSYSFTCSLISLPFLFNTTNETVPPPRAYSLVRQDVLQRWQQALYNIDGGKRYRVGVVWACHPQHENYKRRSIPFDVFSKLFEELQITWVSLQVGERAQELAAANYPVADFSNKLVDYLETAALVRELDLVITVDTSVAHLAGTLGKKTWVLLPLASDWRWQLVREDTPWYAKMRLFRQQSMGEWKDVIEQVKTVLREEISLFT